jgi:uncharacterized protein (DUF2062 family)
LKFSRQIKYYFLRLTRLKGEPQELAMGMALGIFSGMLPIMPFQIALAITLALFFRGSKITAALGTWVTNPLNWYFMYYYSYKIGAALLGLPEGNGVISSVMVSIQQNEEALVVIGKIAGAGGTIVAAFLVGGFIMGFTAAIPSYFIFLRLFQFIRRWRRERRERKNWQRKNR